MCSADRVNDSVQHFAADSLEGDDCLRVLKAFAAYGANMVKSGHGVEDEQWDSVTLHTVQRFAGSDGPEPVHRRADSRAMRERHMAGQINISVQLESETRTRVV